MKKLLMLTLVCALCMTMTIPALAADYDFSTGDKTLSDLGNATSTNEPITPDPMGENERRNKDNSALPPPYFYGSGDIPTDPSSLYHDNTPSSGTTTVTAPPLYGNGTEQPTSGITTPTLDTARMYYADGSIGTLYVSSTKKTIKVYEGEDLSNLKIGAGHFSSTSAWDGNVALCGHNRGNYAYFSFVKNLKIGDTVTYTTKYGSRTYEVFSKEKIDEYDHSLLGWSSENILTLITCIENTPSQRWAAQLREVR